MVYSFLKYLFRIAVKAFFRNKKVLGIENIPNSGPLLIVANHPSTFMDPIVIATVIPGEVNFIAKAEAFKSKFAQWLLPRFNMIPVYRKQYDPSLMHKNKDTFRKVFDLLQSGGNVLIFPEGISITDRKLKEIKTGAARMALGAEEERDFRLNCRIVPVGLTYSDPHKFQSDLVIRIGEPIEVRNYHDMYLSDEVQASKALTEEIRLCIESLVVDIQDEAVDVFVSRVETIYKAKLLHEMGCSDRMIDKGLEVSKMITERIHYFMEQQPQRVEETKQKIDHYFQMMERLNLEDRIIRGTDRKLPVMLQALFWVFYFVIGFPLFVFGAINNYLPYKIPYQIARLMKAEPQFVGAIMMVSGTFIFLLFYLVQIILMQHYFQDGMLTIAYAVLLPISGLFAFRYWRRFIHIRKRWYYFSLFLRRSRLIASMLVLREQILEDLERGRNEYDKLKGNIR
ncbi:MAG TPA: lysophospholipid acyltransferase family protein [Flavobacteriales bacterium]|nr:lysophospholipid acyltransferase family protein [Flavobacteriales bacterium]HRE95608.1 lysophospholipid acyltransferase family protein [Flavobacteriales bacterium]HRJ36606.1 lysophospholipid acyltransferase family protein [Flavobacteriales bacterium]HRJ38543.1 lysophospholipid acyltransferase family protein [Flavobacteriales bacterium]